MIVWYSTYSAYIDVIENPKWDDRKKFSVEIF
jgi:hypothetical protein